MGAGELAVSPVNSSTSPHNNHKPNTNDKSHRQSHRRSVCTALNKESWVKRTVLGHDNTDEGLAPFQMCSDYKLASIM